MADLKPKANIGDKIRTRNVFVHTSRGWRSTWLHPQTEYVVLDIEVTIRLSTGKTEYSYLVGNGEPLDSQWFMGGWTREDTFDKVEEVTEDVD